MHRVSSHPKKLELTLAWKDEPFQLLAPATEKAFSNYKLNEWMNDQDDPQNFLSPHFYCLFPGALAASRGEQGRTCLPVLRKWLDSC